MRHKLRTEIHIDAPPERVWHHLSDLENYARWNPFITSAVGDLAVGQRLELRFEPPGGRAMTLRPRVTEVEPGRVLAWKGQVGLPGILDAEHRFELVPRGEGTTVVQSERFRGLLVPFLRPSLDGPTRRGFEAMDVALRDRATADPTAS